MLRDRRLRFAVVIGVVLIAVALACECNTGGGGGTGPSLTVNNNTSQTVCYLYVSPVTDPNWDTQGDRLGFNTIPAGGSYTVSGFSAGDYDLRADDCDHNQIAVQWGVTINGPVTWNIP